MTEAKSVLRPVRDLQDSASITFDTSTNKTKLSPREVARLSHAVRLPVACHEAIVPSNADLVHNLATQLAFS